MGMQFSVFGSEAGVKSLAVLKNIKLLPPGFFLCWLSLLAWATAPQLVSLAGFRLDGDRTSVVPDFLLSSHKCRLCVIYAECSEL